METLEQVYLSAETLHDLNLIAESQGCSIETMIKRWLASEIPPPSADTHKSQFFDLSLDFFCILDTSGTIVSANRTFVKMVRDASSEIYGVPFLSFIHVDDRATVTSSLELLAQDDSPVSFICRHRFFDETIKWYLWTVYPQATPHAYAIGKDITPYKEMEIKELQRNIFAEALLDTVIAINSSLALDQVLDRILSNVGKVVAYEYVSILLVESDHVEVVGIQNKSPQQSTGSAVRGNRFSITDNEYLNSMYQSHESIIVSEIDHPPVWIEESEATTLKAFLGAPVVVEGLVIGFLCVFNANVGFFTHLHAQQLITFANQAGVAINNARLFEQAQSVAVLHERQRVAQELHDSVNQDLFAASTYADLLPKAISKKPELVPQYAQDISRLIRGAVAQMRMILIELHPSTLVTTGLGVLIQQLCDVFSRQTDIPVVLSVNDIKIILEEHIQVALYRIVQEALHNIEKHAEATQVRTILQITDRQVELIVEDNGSGFNMDTITEVHFGLRGMQERAQSIAAEFLIESQIGVGTKISLRKNLYVQKRSNTHNGDR